MKRLFKKFVTLVLAAATLSTTAVFAQNEMTNMVFAGYDTSDMVNPNYIYNEVVDGKYTDKQILVRVDDKDIQWRTDANCVEKDYPYAGYSVMFLKNPVTGVFDNTYVTAYNNTNPQWQTRRQDWIFQYNRPYSIVERQQTNTSFAGWQWDFGNLRHGIPDSALVFVKKENAKNVKNVWDKYGFAQYDNAGVMLDYYRTLKDAHCDTCVDFTYYCTDCLKQLPVEYWSKEDAEMYAVQNHFNVLNAAVYGDGAYVKFTPANLTDLIDLVLEVRATNAHVAKCPVSVGCDHPFHQVKEISASGEASYKLTVAGQLKDRYGIEGWNEVVVALLTSENLTARGTIDQEMFKGADGKAKYPRSVYGNLLEVEGANRYYLTDDILSEIIPSINARVISGSFKEDSAIMTYNLADEYIKSEVQYETTKNTPISWPEYKNDDENNRAWVRAERIKYIAALADNDTAWKWYKYGEPVPNYAPDETDWVLNVKYNGKIEWTTPNFEAAVPHKYYQYLIVNDIVLDGTNNKPLVWRYTGANANPNVEWKLDSFVAVQESDVNANTLGLYAAVERMYINGARTIYTRIPAIEFNAPAVSEWMIGNVANEYAYSYFTPAEDGKYTDYYITDNKGINILVYRQINYGTINGSSVNPNNDKLGAGNTVFAKPTIG